LKSKFFNLTIILALLALLPLPTSASNWQQLEKGLSYQLVTAPSGKFFRLHAFKINPKLFNIRPLLPESKKRDTIHQLTQASGALLGINANFFDPDGKILGLVVDKGKVVHPFKKISWWSLFYMKRSRPYIIHSSKFRSAKNMTVAFQAGPRLVINGVLPKLKQEISAKTAVGINSRGELILTVTRDAVDIQELAKLMALSEQKGGLGCSHALNLDGGSSSQLYVEVGDFKLDLPSFMTIPVGLGVFRIKN